MKVQFYVPSDLCGAGGMLQKTIHANLNYAGSPHFDTVFISVGDKEAIDGLLATCILLLFSFFDSYHGKNISCALIAWFMHPKNGPECDILTRM